MRWPWQKKVEEKPIPDIVYCPDCGAVNHYVWEDSLAGIMSCTQCGRAGWLQEFRRKSPPGTVATHEVIPA